LSTNQRERNREIEAAARTCLVRYGRIRLFLSRCFESLLRPYLYFTREQGLQGNGDPRNIVVIEYWYLGDIVMVTPFLKNLRIHYPKAHIAIVASPRALPILEGQGLVDEVISVNVPWAQHMSRRRKYLSRSWADYCRCIAQLRHRQFDLGFTVRADIRDNFLLRVGKVKKRVGYGYGFGGSLLTDVVEPDLSKPHYSDRWLQLLEHLKKPALDRQPELKLSREQRAFAKKFLQERGLDDGQVLIGFHSGARNLVRQWGEEKFLEVANRLSKMFPIRILWFRDPGTSEPKNHGEFVPVSLPLAQFLAVLSECKVLVCNDTGPMHLASAHGISVVSVFGPGMPGWWGPRSEGSRVVFHDGVWCRPCLDYCRFDRPYCLDVVTVDEVYEAVAEVVRSALRSAVPDKRANGVPKLMGVRSEAEQMAD
jgi:ADP-heptose:LPS heptosyltransferase